MLNALGITTCRDLYDQRATLLLLFSKVSSQFFFQICLGVGSSDIHQCVYINYFVAGIVDLQSIILSMLLLLLLLLHCCYCCCCCCCYIVVVVVVVTLLLLLSHCCCYCCCCCCCRVYERKSMSTERYTVNLTFQ